MPVFEVAGEAINTKFIVSVSAMRKTGYEDHHGFTISLAGGHQVKPVFESGAEASAARKELLHLAAIA